MAFTNAERQRRWRRRRADLVRANPAVIEAELLQDVRRCERGEFSVRARAALAERLTIAAFGHRCAAAEFERLARKVRGS